MIVKLPAPLINVIFKDTEEGHFYSVDGKDVMMPGVTTVLKVLGKPALVPWAAKCAAKAFGEKIKKEGRLPNDSKELEDWIKEASKAPTKERNAAGENGTNIHKSIDEYLSGKPSSEPINHFVDWERACKWTFVAGDTPVASVKHLYGGRLDSLFRDEQDRLVLVDFKTSKGVYPDHLIQVGAYSMAFEETYGLKVSRAGILHIRPGGVKWIECKNLKAAETAWVNVRNLYELLNQLSKQMEVA